MQLRSTKVTWVVLGLIVVINISFFGFGMLLFVLNGPWEYFIFLALLPIIWLYGIFNWIGFDVFGKANEFMAAPSNFGYLLIIIGTLVSLVAYYLIANKISQWWHSKKLRELKING